eukprot:COSAG06_NODE_46067_length_349_cov_5.860000_1_plen_48_part_01
MQAANYKDRDTRLHRQREVFLMSSAPPAPPAAPRAKGGAAATRRGVAA